jgi:succinate dehydrogenase/fumarate reductase flavoprotein subunit
MSIDNIEFEEQVKDWDEITDVVVIGSGFAGLTAAIEVRNAGKTVKVFEKMKAIGGNSIISDGGIAAPGTEIQQKYGIQDSTDIMYKDMLKAGLGINYPCVGIADSKAVDMSGWSIERCLKKGVVKKFNTVKEFSTFYNIPFEEGKDKYFNKPLIEKADKIENPPFYGVRLWPKVHHTMGGIRINSGAQVMDYNNQCIKGLYAAGEITGGIHGASRLGSCAITECIVFGRIAGKNVTK